MHYGFGIEFLDDLCCNLFFYLPIIWHLELRFKFFYAIIVNLCFFFVLFIHHMMRHNLCMLFLFNIYGCNNEDFFPFIVNVHIHYELSEKLSFLEVHMAFENLFLNLLP